jgi:hypothetical protein
MGICSKFQGQSALSDDESEFVSLNTPINHQNSFSHESRVFLKWKITITFRHTSHSKPFLVKETFLGFEIFVDLEFTSPFENFLHV